MIFILGTGRCGTKSLMELLNQWDDIYCLHEPPPILRRETAEYLYGDKEKGELIRVLKETRQEQGDGEYAESNQRLSFAVDALAEAFPGARFIWVLRSGLDVVASTYRRRWYFKGEENAESHWQRYRVQGDKAGAMSPQQWAALDCFERNCWYWAWTNTKIRADLNHIQSPSMMLRIEDLEEEEGRIADFIGRALPQSIRIPRSNTSSSYSQIPVKPCGWDGRQRKGFSEICGPLMDEYYPGWRQALALSPWRRFRNACWGMLSERKPLGRLVSRTFRVLPSSFQAPFRWASRGRRN